MSTGHPLKSHRGRRATAQRRGQSLRQLRGLCGALADDFGACYQNLLDNMVIYQCKNGIIYTRTYILIYTYDMYIYIITMFVYIYIYVCMYVCVYTIFVCLHIQTDIVHMILPSQKRHSIVHETLGISQTCILNPFYWRSLWETSTRKSDTMVPHLDTNQCQWNIDMLRNTR